MLANPNLTFEWQTEKLLFNCVVNCYGFTCIATCREGCVMRTYNQSDFDPSEAYTLSATFTYIFTVEKYFEKYFTEFSVLNGCNDSS